jgi:hypothetical protein
VNDDSFYFDSGASAMMTPRKRDFYELHVCDGPIYQSGNGPIKAVGVGTIRISSFTGKEYIQLELKDVYYMPTLPVALFSEPVIRNMGIGTRTNPSAG